MTTKFAFLESIDILSTIPQSNTLLGAFLMFWIVWLIAKKRFNGRRSLQPTDNEVRRKLMVWQPEPLVPDVDDDCTSLKRRRVTCINGKRIIINGNDCLNVGTHNYLSLSENKEIREKAAMTINKYGVGSCGPRGFYGTVDVHLDLEECLAKFMNMEEAVVYSYGFSTIASAIPAYCKRNDLVFVDERVNFAIQKGLDASRSDIKYFKHNDVEDLKKLLLEQEKNDARRLKKAVRTRRFLIVEGIYANTGDICPLPELIGLCEKYKLRIFIDESVSFGTLGIHGKGVTEYFNVSRHRVDMIMGSLDWAIASIGGFCVGSSFVIEHQRLSGLGYCFSASLPPLLTSTAIASLDLMEHDPQIFETLKQNCLSIDYGLRKIKYFDTVSAKESPVKHLYMKQQLTYIKERELLSVISEQCIYNHLAVITPAYLETEKYLSRPSLRICVSVALTEKDISYLLKTLEKCAAEVLRS